MRYVVRGQIGDFTVSKSIVEQTLAYLKHEVPGIEDIIVEQACLGWGYSAIRLSTNDVGICHSLLGEGPPNSCQILRQVGTLAGSPAAELADLAKSWDLGERVVGLATISALSQIILKGSPKGFTMTEGNTLDELDIKTTDTVAMVGNIRPFVKPIARKASNLFIFERGGPFQEGIYPDTACEVLLPRADVVIITGSAIANGTMDRLLQLSRTARKVAIAGPSASIAPAPLFKNGADIVGGVIVTDADKVLRIVAEGGGALQLKSAVRFVTMKPRHGSRRTRSKRAQRFSC
jgi:uncharacterized protein (DUF4213/DUF364 family)